MSHDVQFHLGDCVEIMATFAENSVDAICTDPPYGLEFMGAEWDRLDGGLPQENVWKGRRGKGGSNVGHDDTKPGSRHHVAFGATRSRFRRCTTCGKRQFSGSPCQCETPEWVYETPEGAPSSAIRMQRWHLRWATEALRVLKPGGHLLAFGGSRTFHRLVCAVEDAGFEIRDTLAWLYGSGFPKSLDVSKAIDKQRDDYDEIRRVVEFIRASARDRQENSASIAASLGWGEAVAAHFLAPSRSNAGCPQWDQWLALKVHLGFGDEMDAEVWRLNGRKGKPGENWDKREVVGAKPSSLGGTVAAGLRDQEFIAKHRDMDFDVTLPATDAAKQWDGWGTALKPAVEYITLARKPLSEKNVASNVLRHGTGALNIDACRIGTETIRTSNGKQESEGWRLHKRSKEWASATAGRWPANLLLAHNPECRVIGTRTVKGDPREGGKGHRQGGFADVGAPSGSEEPNGKLYGDQTVDVWECAPDCAVRMLDEQSGESKSQGGSGDASKTWKGNGRTVGAWIAGATGGYGDKGFASRFFYTAKSSRADRDSRSGYHVPAKFFNSHPTVKPVDLMRWLVRLVTPPGGVVLDPFLGSGSTAVAAILEGFRVIGIEQDPESMETARARAQEVMPLFTRGMG